MLKLLTALIFMVSMTGCLDNILTGSENSNLDDGFDNTDSISQPSYGLGVNNDNLPTIDSSNATNFPVSGQCDPSAGDVTVTVGFPDTTETFPCGSGGTFSGTMDVSAVVSSPPNMTASQGASTSAPVPGPSNDQEGPASAPSATPPATAVGNASGPYNLPVNCQEAGEVITITGIGLNPAPQTYTCTGAGSENFPLTFFNPFESANPNNLIMTSVDALGNPGAGPGTINVPIDTIAPTVVVVAGSNITQGLAATFTITVTDGNYSTPSYNVTTSGAESASYPCTTNPCVITTAGIVNPGDLTLTVAIGDIVDDAGNTNAAGSSGTLTVIPAGPVGFSDPMPTINSTNASAYPVSGPCDVALGNVTVSVGNPLATTSIPCLAPGNYSGTIDVSGVIDSPPTMDAQQGANPAVSASPLPINDQNPIGSAPVIPDQAASSDLSNTVPVNCTEPGEVISFSGGGLQPDPQTITCPDPLNNPENVTLTFANPTESSDPNNITVASVDANGNPSGATTTFNMPVDSVPPQVFVTAGVNIVEGYTAEFTIDVVEGGTFTAFTPTVSSGIIMSGPCMSSPCLVEVAVPALGTLTLTVAAGDIVDGAGNINAAGDSDSLNVAGSSLEITSAPTANSVNNTAYPISGNCDPSDDVNITIGSPDQTATATCSGLPGTFSTTIDVSSVTDDPMNINVNQNGNTDSLTATNDPFVIANAPVVADKPATNGAGTDVTVECNEAGEVVTFSNPALDPNPQTYTCTTAGPQMASLTFASPVETGDPNTITVTSEDANGNPTTNPGSFNLPIDNVAPVVSVVAGADVGSAGTASFTVTVVEGDSFAGFIPAPSSGAVTSGACTASPCSVTVTGMDPGTLTLTVNAGNVIDPAGNGNAAAASDDLIVCDSSQPDGSTICPYTNFFQLQSAQPADGEYNFDFGGGLFEASVQKHEGIMWMLWLQYHHEGGTNPNLNTVAINNNLPIYDDSPLGTNLSGDLTKFGHGSQAFAASIPESNIKLRWQGSTSAHSRVIHFESPQIGRFQNDAGDFANIASTFRAYDDHSTFLPANSDAFNFSSGDSSLTGYPFYELGSRHWAIKGTGNRWEVDDYPTVDGDPNGYFHDTIHRIWVGLDVITSLSTVGGRPDGQHTCLLDNTMFDCVVDNTTSGGPWLLVARGRDNWNWTEDGRGEPGDIAADLPGGGGGTPGTVGPTTFDTKFLRSSIIDELLSNDNLQVNQIETRIKRAFSADGSIYQDVRWFIDRTTWSWRFDQNYTFYQNATLDGVDLSPCTTTRDSICNGNNEKRMWTYFWGGMAGRQGFTYGISNSDWGSPTDPNNFGWKKNEPGQGFNHTLPYAEVWLRIKPAIQSLSDLDGLPDGDHACSLDNQTFDCKVDNTTDGGGWLLVGRGRENWNWSEAGAGNPGEVVQALAGGGGGTPGNVGASTFTPKYLSSTIINDLLANGSHDVSDIEVRLKRATIADGSNYQDIRWFINRTTWSWLFSTTYSFYQNPTVDGVDLGACPTTRDSGCYANDSTRVYTPVYQGFDGFAQGLSSDWGSPTDPNNFGWKIDEPGQGQNHTKPYTEVYIRRVAP